MIECIMWADDEESESGETVLSSMKGRLEEVLLPRESPSLLKSERNVVIVMDALKDFSREPLQWTLNNVIRSGCTVTFLGVMPWLPLACELSFFNPNSTRSRFQKIGCLHMILGFRFS